ncbi:MAG TPA: hypothetical protein VFS00_20795 [Polyangiaceae bacterium]|nr:hypothetical protein [Polyangiaceae bacterium]
MSGRARALLAAAALASAAPVVGCGGGRSSGAKYAGQAAAAPPVYLETVPARPYRERGLVQAYGTGTKASEAALLGSLRERGKSMGCDALANVNVEVGEMKAYAIGVCVEWADEGVTGSPGPEP